MSRLNPTDYKARVEALRRWLRGEGLNAYVVPTLDPHNSEYLPFRWQTREWLTGFTGSAGLAVVTLEKPRSGPTRAISCKPRSSWQAQASN